MKTPSLKTLLCLGSLLAFASTLTARTPDATEHKQLEGTWVGGVRNPGVRGKSGQGTMVQISELIIKIQNLLVTLGKRQLTFWP